MEIRKIQNIVMSSLLIAGLAGCSSSPSTSHTDSSSPWKSKRSAEVAGAASAEFVEVSLDQAAPTDNMEAAPVIEEPMAQSEMAMQPELESISDFNPEPVPVESMSAFEKLNRGAEFVETEKLDTNVASTNFMNASPTAFAVQVYAGRKLANVNRYVSSHGLENMQIVKTERDGDVIYVLVSIHDDRESAMQALNDLEQSTGSKPWIRSVAGLKAIAAQ